MSDVVLGSKVRLRSGGPVMTVVSLRPENKWSIIRGAEVVRFEQTKVVDWFPLAALEVVP